MCGIWALFGYDGEAEGQSGRYDNCMKVSHRGPDQFRIESISDYRQCTLGFHRLAIVGHDLGMQPMQLHALQHLVLIYNGEIYNYKLVQKEFGFDYETDCDGEAILHLYAKGGIEFAAAHLDGVFAFCLVDKAQQKVYLGRDTYGVRPSFRILTETGCLAVCSEAKGITQLFKTEEAIKCEPVLPGHVETYNLDCEGRVTLKSRIKFHSIGNAPLYNTLVSTDACHNGNTLENIRTLLTAAVRKRLMTNRRIGCLLSGGLDSSLVAGLLTKVLNENGTDYPLQTFSVGMQGSTDLAFARQVAGHIQSEHHEVVFTEAEGIDAIKATIYHLESYDITTIRASIGMYIVSKYIALNTDSVVIFSGEGADEVAQGYIYFHKAPDADSAHKESLRLLQDLYMFDVCRADRSTAAHGLELRVPFLDHQFTSYYLSIPAAQKIPQRGVEKLLIRQAFDGMDLIPENVLWRPKEAFSDGVSSDKKSWFEILQGHIKNQVSDSQLQDAPLSFPENPPFTKEGYYYRHIFEEYYPGQAKFVPYNWMPRWTNATDPSARTLSHYKQ